jgi:altronate hydrolase
MGFPVPTLKISSNTPLAERKPQWIDFNAGEVADGSADFAACEEALWSQIIDIASGRKRTRNEERAHREIAIWKDGVTL